MKHRPNSFHLISIHIIFYLLAYLLYDIYFMKKKETSANKVDNG